MEPDICLVCGYQYTCDHCIVITIVSLSMVGFWAGDEFELLGISISGVESLRFLGCKHHSDGYEQT